MCVCVVCPGDIDGTLGDLGERIGAQRMTKYGDGGKDVSWGVWVGIDLKGGRETQSFGIRNVCWAGGKEGGVVNLFTPILLTPYKDATGPK